MDNVLFGRFAGFSFVWIKQNSTFFSFLILVNLFRTKTDGSLFVVIEFSTHCESVHTVILGISTFSSFDTNLRFLIPISNASNSSHGIEISVMF